MTRQIITTTRPPIDAHLSAARPRPRAPEGMPVVICVVWIAGCAFGALVTALAGWMW